jgi:hypothetical protein
MGQTRKLLFFQPQFNFATPAEDAGAVFDRSQKRLALALASH